MGAKSAVEAWRKARERSPGVQVCALHFLAGKVARRALWYLVATLLLSSLLVVKVLPAAPEGRLLTWMLGGSAMLTPFLLAQLLGLYQQARILRKRASDFFQLQRLEPDHTEQVRMLSDMATFSQLSLSMHKMVVEHQLWYVAATAASAWVAFPLESSGFFSRWPSASEGWLPYAYQMPVAYAVSLAALLGGLFTCGRLVLRAARAKRSPSQGEKPGAPAGAGEP